MENKDKLNITVVGGGHGGLAEASYLSFLGYKITLFNRTLRNVAAVKPGVEIIGCLNNTVHIYNVTDNLISAIEQANIIFIILPAYAHKDILRKIRDHLTDGQVIVLMPGKFGGGLEALEILKGLNKNISVFETESVVVGARRSGEAQVNILGIKLSVKIGGVNLLRDGASLLRDFKLLKAVHPEFILVDNIMEASFSEVGCILHPVISLLNAARIEGNQSFLFYIDGVTTSVAKVIEALDHERVEIAQAYGVSVESVSETTKRYYQTPGNDIDSVLKNTYTYKDVKAPTSINNRYLVEEALVSLSSYRILARLAGIEVPVIDSIISFTKCVCSLDYQITERSLSDLGYGGYGYLQLKDAIVSLSIQK